MAKIVDNIELDEANVEFNLAVDLVQKRKKLIYLTGKAGSGKTTFLKYIRQSINRKTVVLAPTGVAALNAGGQTIHSFFKIAPSIYVPDDYRLRTKANPHEDDGRTIFDHFKYKKGHKKLIKEMELLVIDEVSMVRCDLLDVVDKLLRAFRNKETEPFGGLQVLLIGDAFQLPPIAQNDQWGLLRNYYDTPFFFSSLVLKKYPPYYIELKKIYRQRDQKFIDLLNRVRINKVTQEDIELLNSRFIPSVFKDDNTEYITIATHNRIVDETNARKLNALPSKLKTYEADITGDFPEKMMPTERALNLKVGSQIMFIRNDVEKKSYFNGKLGKIKELSKDEIIVETLDKKEIKVPKYSWHNIRYSWNTTEGRINEEVIGEFTQFPIKLAWAVTVHKCQGLTFEKVIADLRQSFSPGQVYVALSRCTSLDGLVLKSKINRSIIKTDQNVINFASNENGVKSSL
jgi:ATP-dependent exoDNAse (exonuclease V) alpha subunit